MKKKIAILGSTGSIGRATLDILKKNKANFQVILLTANSNYKIILKQIKEFQPKYFIINDNDVYKKIKKKINLKKNKVQIINKFKNFNFNIKFDITISAIVGIAGLEPTIQFTKINKLERAFYFLHTFVSCFINGYNYGKRSISPSLLCFNICKLHKKINLRY